MKTPILSIDFDGVLHSYISGWQGARNIPDPPVDGAIHWLRSLLSDPECVCAMAPRHLDFDVRIFSSRARYIGGRRAMKKWLFKHFKAIGEPGQCVELLKFPLFKPPSFLHIDDRSWTFAGVFPTIDFMKGFKPWLRNCAERHDYPPPPMEEQFSKWFAKDFDERFNKAMKAGDP